MSQDELKRSCIANCWELFKQASELFESSHVCFTEPHIVCQTSLAVSGHKSCKQLLKKLNRNSIGTGCMHAATK